MSTNNEAPPATDNMHMITSLPTTASESLRSVTDSLSNVSKMASETIDTAKSSLNNAVSDFSSKSAVDAGTEFLNANSIIARFVFILLVLIVFVILMNLGIWLIDYFTSASRSPYIVNGLISGSESITIDQNPKNTNSIQILKSNNEPSGMEFTWSSWLFINSPDPTNYNCIFVKGTIPTNTPSTNPAIKSGLSTVNNAPGLYIVPQTNANLATVSLILLMDTASKNSSSLGNSETITIPNVPLKKWFHIDIRLQNKIMDVYINGVVTSRKIFDSIPKQNYDNIYVCPNGGFKGYLSDLRYFNYALGVIQINSIVNSGVNLSPNTNTTSISNRSYSSYLSNNWYNANM